MNTHANANQKHRPTRGRDTLRRALGSLCAVALGLSLIAAAYPFTRSPFVGLWRAIDQLDDSLIRVTILGPVNGRFSVTWTESYFTFCESPYGLAVGAGRLNPENPNILEAEMRLRCFGTGESVRWHQVWEYRPAYDVLASQGDYGVETIWVRPGRSLVPRMDLRVNYGHDWVESFYEAGHTVRLTVTGPDGVATAEVLTEPKDFWGWETGFQTQEGDWDPGLPDIQAGDWVFAQVDNGQTARVQIGEIAGTIDLAADSIQGTIAAPWFSSQEEVSVECFPWGAPGPVEMRFDGVLPEGDDTYSCSWAGEWDIQPGQDVGVAYVGPDGHWVANAFFITTPTFVAYMPGTIEGYDWPMGDEITLNINGVDYPYTAYSEQRPGSPDGSTRVLFELWQHDFFMQAGDHVFMTDESIGLTKDVVVTNLAVTGFELSAGTVTGVFNPAYDLWVWLYGQEGQVPAKEGDVWTATFAELPPGVWGGATQWDADGDGTSIDFQVPNPNFYVVPDENRIYANEWIEGGEVSLTIFHPDGGSVYTESRVVPPPSERPWTEVLFESGFVLEPGQRIVINQGGYERELIVSSIRVTGFDLGAQTVSGVGDPGAPFFVRIGGMDEWGTVGDEGTWSVHHGDLAAAVWGEAIQPDADGDSTRDIFGAPNPNFYAVPDENRIYANEWIEGGEVSLTIFHPDGGSVYTESRVVPPPSERPWTEVLFESGFVLEPGQRIVINQGGYERELIVSSIRVTGFDLGAQTVSGVGDPGAPFFVRIGGTDEWGTVGDEGTWSVHHGDLAAAVWGEAIQPDVDGDATRDGFQAPEL